MGGGPDRTPQMKRRNKMDVLYLIIWARSKGGSTQKCTTLYSSTIRMKINTQKHPAHNKGISCFLGRIPMWLLICFKEHSVAPTAILTNWTHRWPTSTFTETYLFLLNYAEAETVKFNCSLHVVHFRQLEKSILRPMRRRAVLLRIEQICSFVCFKW